MSAYEVGEQLLIEVPWSSTPANAVVVEVDDDELVVAFEAVGDGSVGTLVADIDSFAQRALRFRS